MLIENLVIYTRKPYEDSNGRMIYHGYILPKESEHYTAQRWSGWEKGNATLLDFAESGKTFPTFKDVVIKSLDHRGNGGRAYQVIFPIEGKENFYVLCDLREDALMDAIFTQGIEKGGKLNGEYAFIRIGSQTNLALVGSDDYEVAKSIAQRKKEARKISNKELKVGYEYSTHYGRKAVYLGAYYHIESYSFGGSVKVSETPKITHVFVRGMDSNYKDFDFKKAQQYTIESENPVISEEEAKAYFIEHYVNVTKEKFEKALRDIEGRYLEQYNLYQSERGHSDHYKNEYKWHYERRLREELNKLREYAHECYRQSIVSDDKKKVVLDKESARTRIDEAIKRGEESIAEYDFNKGDK